MKSDKWRNIGSASITNNQTKEKSKRETMPYEPIDFYFLSSVLLARPVFFLTPSLWVKYKKSEQNF